MKTLVLTEQEAIDLKEFYILEMARAKRQLLHYQQVLEKLEDVDIKVPEKKLKTAKPATDGPKKGRGRPKKVVSDVVAVEPVEKKTPAKKKAVKAAKPAPADADNTPKRRGRPKKEVIPAVEVAKEKPVKKAKEKEAKASLPKPRAAKPKKAVKPETAAPEAVVSEMIAPKPPKKTAPKPKKAKKTAKKKRAPKKPAALKAKDSGISWTNFIFETLKEKGNGLSVIDFLDLAVQKYNIPTEKIANARTNVAACLSNLANKSKRLSVATGESKLKVYSLPETTEPANEPVTE